MKMSKQEYAAIIQAWADGKELQWLSPTGTWRDRSTLVDADPPANDIVYRVKPEVILVNGIEAPKPFDGVLAYEQDYFRCVDYDGEFHADECCNYTPSTGAQHVATGMVHLTREAAELHAKALNTKPEPKLTSMEFRCNLGNKGVLFSDGNISGYNLRLSFDVLTGKLLSAEVI